LPEAFYPSHAKDCQAFSGDDGEIADCGTEEKGVGVREWTIMDKMDWMDERGTRTDTDKHRQSWTGRAGMPIPMAVLIDLKSFCFNPQSKLNRAYLYGVGCR